MESVLEKCSVRDLLNMLVLRWIDAYSWASGSCSSGNTPKSSIRQTGRKDTQGVGACNLFLYTYS